MKRLFTTVALTGLLATGLLATGAVYAQSTTTTGGNGSMPQGAAERPGTGDSQLNDPNNGTTPSAGAERQPTNTTSSKKTTSSDQAYRPDGKSSSPPQAGSGPGTAEPSTK